MFLKHIGCLGEDRIQLKMEGFCGHGIELSASIKSGNYLPPAKLFTFKVRYFYHKVLFPIRMQRKGHNHSSSHCLPVRSVHNQGLACCFPELASGRIDVD
jgi:hypothetical protein